EATITITTIGDPKFVPGITPPARPRPYTPPPESEAARAAMRNAVNVALNRPSRASSESPGHPARHANDGDRATAWRGDGDDPQAWWLVDLEGFYQLASLKLVFAGEGNFRFRIKVSNDAKVWMATINRTATDNIRAERNDVFPPGTIG